MTKYKLIGIRQRKQLNMVKILPIMKGGVIVYFVRVALPDWKLLEGNLTGKTMIKSPPSGKASRFTQRQQVMDSTNGCS